jgi:hypothetical protein
LNGAPARLVVPGWTATYWLKKLVSVRALDRPLESFWMQKAYRLPKGRFAMVDRFVTQESADTVPVTEIVVNSLITSLADGQRTRAGDPVTVSGIAWDGGYGIRGVDVSTDGGATWRAADLGPDAGRFSFRPFRYVFTPPAGHYVVSARASNAVGASQVEKAIANGAGYHHNAYQRLGLEVT